MKLKKLLAVALATAISLFCGVPALAATEKKESSPDIIFYRAKAKETFSGELVLPGKGTITEVQFQAGEDPAFSIADYGDIVEFEDLYRSAKQTLLVTRDGKTEDITCGLAVYDIVELLQDTGSVTLTVKDNKTLKPISGVEYALYRGSKRIEEGFVSNSAGKITVEKLEPGNYELRPSTAADGYLATSTAIPFTIGGIELEGGEITIRTTAGKKIIADDNEILIAGGFSPDVELAATKEEQIEAVTVTLKNYGATIDETGKDLKKTFSGAKEAQQFLNEEKNNWKICGAVEISYKLKSAVGKSTCNYVQYLEAKPISQATPAPTPDNGWNQGQTGSNNGNTGGNSNGQQNTGTITTKPTATPAPVVTATPAPSETNLTLLATTNNGDAEGISFSVIGAKASNGSSYSQYLKTDENGQIQSTVPFGTYTVSLVTSAYGGESFEPAEPQSLIVENNQPIVLRFNLTRTTRNFKVTVRDDDGLPLQNVTLGLFRPLEGGTVQEERPVVTAGSATDISKALAEKQQEAETAEKLADPYTRANAVSVANTDANGEAAFTNVPAEDLVAAVIAAPEGYATGSTPVSVPCNWAEDYSLLCEYVKVDIDFRSEAAQAAPIGATAALLTNNGVELTSWEVASEPHRLIRIPAGKYTLDLSFNDTPTEAFELEITDTLPLQTVQLTTAMTGNAEIPEPEPDKGASKARNYILFGVLGVAAVAGIVAGIVCFRRWRKRKGGLR